MRILHLCLSNFYVDSYSYQENELVRQNVLDGHSVEIIASTETIDAQGEVCYTEPRRYMGGDGAMVERVRYRRWLPHAVMRKLRMHPGIFARIEAFKPNVILFHSACGWELFAAARYVRQHRQVKFYVDSHEDFVNSARGFVSKWILHFLYYRTILRLCLAQVDQILPVNMGAFEFMRDFYGVPGELIELYPLGSQIDDDKHYAALRSKTRADLKIGEDQLLIVQSGKIDSSKKLVEALEAFAEIDDPALVFAISGLLKPDIRSEVQQRLAKDPRVRFLGWNSPDELRALLSAADIYCQPGTQSATMQMSLACRCAVIIDDVSSHKPYFDDNGWLVGKTCTLNAAFSAVSNRKDAIPLMQSKSHQVALRMLDYRLLAARIYH